MEEIKLSKEVSSMLIKILTESKDANLLLSGFISGKELTGKKISLVGEFKITITE